MAKKSDIGPAVPRDRREYLRQLKENLRVLRWAWREFVQPETRRGTTILLMVLGVNLGFSLLRPWVVGEMFTSLADKDATGIIIALAGVLALVIAGQLTDNVYLARRERIEAQCVASINDKTNALFMEKSLGQHLAEHGSLSPANIEKGRNHAMAILDIMLFGAITDVFTLVIALVLLWFIAPVAGAVLTLMLATHLIWSSYLNIRTAQVSIPLNKEFREYEQQRFERWDKIVRVKTCAKERDETLRLNGWFTDLMDRNVTLWTWFIRHITARNAAAWTVHWTVVCYGAWQVFNGVWELGFLYPLFSWSGKVCENSWRISSTEHRLSKVMPSVRAMMETLTAPPDITDAADAAPLDGAEPLSVRIAGLTHAYADERGGPDLSRPVLKDVTLDIGPGEKVALLGKSGAGKTTIMRMVLRFMDPVSGTITVNGTDLRKVPLEKWLGLVGYIPQDAAIFDGTIRYNLLFGLTDAQRAAMSEERLWEIVRMLRIDFGDRLTAGLDTKVGRDGVKLSGGEAQRVMIGAAAIKRPRFMVIDEATSSLDAMTEHDVHKGLKRVLTPDMSALVITHRLATVRNLCTKFVLLRSASDIAANDPQIEAQARSFEELYRISPTFRELADEQGIVIHP